MPKLTVLMSVHNGERWLRECIDSVLSQSESDFEFIIINDGSTDGTGAILNSYADGRIVAVAQENAGLTKSLNTGLGLSKGEFIARIDADDMCMPDRFCKQRQFLLENPEIVLVGSNARLIDENGKCMGRAVYPRSHKSLVERLTISFRSVFPHSSVFFRKSIVMQEGGYVENFVRSQDYDLYLRLSEKYRIANIDEFLVKIRLNFSGATYYDDNQLIMGLAALISHYRREADLSDYSKTDDSNWHSLLSSVRAWVSETGWDRKHQSRVDFRRCHTLFRQRNYPKAFQAFVKSLYRNPTFLLDRTIRVNIPKDIQQFLNEGKPAT